MLIDAILEIHDKIQNTKLGINREREITQLEADALVATPTILQKGLMR
jgi:NADH-quinone oxidoreductase subunit B